MNKTSSTPASTADTATEVKTPKKPSADRSCYCIVSGAKKMVRPEVLEKRILRYGSKENLEASYVCTESKQELREGKPVDQIRKEYQAAHPTATVPTATVPQTILDEILKKKAPKTADTTADVNADVTDGTAKKAAHSKSKKSAGGGNKKKATTSDVTPVAVAE